jgi:transcriptional regulator with GAF, ATPase, and Fis domain
MPDAKHLIIEKSYIEKWQSIVDTLAEIINVPSGLIMRVVNEKISVFVSSDSQGNPYKPGESEILKDSGLYCEKVITTRNKLMVPNARKDELWKNNPDIKLNMISYLGFPIVKPDESPFGTLCVLDNKENHFSELYIKLMKNFREIIENDLKMIYMNQALGERSKKLIEFISEIQSLRGILRICAHCKKIKNEKDEWVGLETYIENHSDVEFSHGLCGSCLKELYGDKKWFKERNN